MAVEVGDVTESVTSQILKDHEYKHIVEKSFQLDFSHKQKIMYQYIPYLSTLKCPKYLLIQSILLSGVSHPRSTQEARPPPLVASVEAWTKQSRSAI